MTPYESIYTVVRRIPRGRVATPEAYAHLGARPVESVLDFDDL